MIFNVLFLLSEHVQKYQEWTRSIVNLKHRKMLNTFDNNTPIAILTVGQLKEILGIQEKTRIIDTTNSEKKFVYGIAGIAKIFDCSIPTANRIKASGKIDKAITQIGRKIIVDIDLALELAGKKEGGRR